MLESKKSRGIIIGIVAYWITNFILFFAGYYFPKGYGDHPYVPSEWGGVYWMIGVTNGLFFLILAGCSLVRWYDNGEVDFR